MIDWTTVFGNLRRIGFEGPVSVHCEFEVPRTAFLQAVKREIAFFKRVWEGAQTKGVG